MIAFLWIVMLALLWSAMTETFTLSNLAVGFVFGYAILYVSQHVLGVSGFVRKLPRLLAFLLYFAKELVVANLRVAHDVVTPRYHMRPGIIAIPLDARTDIEIVSLANLISLTPGTVTLDVSTDRRVMYVYAMFIDDPETIIAHSKNGLERRLLELLR